MTLRATVETYCRRKTGRAPDLASPKGYNDKLAWLKLHDQMPEQITCCDKLAARAYVGGVIGWAHLLEVHQVAPSVTELDQRALPAMVKANCDSGSAMRAVDRATWRQACQRVGRALGRVYGTAGGEWAYARVPRRCFTEELLPRPVIEYKFHCGSGHVLWAQIIAGRDAGAAAEVVTDADGRRLPLHFNVRNARAKAMPQLPPTWGRMVDTAQELSRPFRYVRVDLYSHAGKVYFGELTFWPLAGICQTADEQAFGALLDIDMSWERPPLAC